MTVKLINLSLNVICEGANEYAFYDSVQWEKMVEEKDSASDLSKVAQVFIKDAVS